MDHERPPLRRWYRVTYETLSPLHISLGPEALLIPGEECDVIGDDVTLVLDRPALIDAFATRGDTVAGAAPAAAPLRRLTYRDVLANKDHPDYDLVLKEFQIMRKLKLAQLDDPLPNNDEPTPAPPQPAAPPAAAWAALATTRPRELAARDKLWLAPDGATLIRYQLTGTPATPGRTTGHWFEAVQRLPRTPDMGVLIPGSSVKGAWRSLLAYAQAKQLGAANLAQLQGSNLRFAAQAMEQRVLAPNAPSPQNAPNHDAGRLLLARDIALDPGIRAGIVPFGLATARQWRPFPGGGTQQAAVAVEALPRGTRFEGRMAIDVDLLDHWRDRESKREVFAPLRPALTQDLAPLLAAGRELATAQLSADAQLYTASHTRRAAAFTAELKSLLADLPPQTTLLRLGWGTGQQSKTPFAVLLNQFQADRYPAQRSRRLTITPTSEADLPFGWVLCTISSADTS